MKGLIRKVLAPLAIAGTLFATNPASAEENKEIDFDGNLLFGYNIQNKAISEELLIGLSYPLCGIKNRIYFKAKGYVLLEPEIKQDGNEYEIGYEIKYDYLKIGLKNSYQTFERKNETEIEIGIEW